MTVILFYNNRSTYSIFNLHSYTQVRLFVFFRNVTYLIIMECGA
jgi:hypothetical protein